MFSFYVTQLCNQSLRRHTACPAQAVVGSGIGLGMAKTKAMCVRSLGLPRQGDATSRAASPAEVSPKSVVGSYSLDTVPVSWDDSPPIRDRIRCGKNLLVKAVNQPGDSESDRIDATQENVRANAIVLKPILVIMAQNELQLPSIESLIGAIEGFYLLPKLFGDRKLSTKSRGQSDA